MMNFQSKQLDSSKRIDARLRWLDLPAMQPVDTMADDIYIGLTAADKHLPCKYLYDAHGSELFDQICDVPEYYPTRTESQLLAQHAAQIIDKAQPDFLLELGSGTSRKTEHLLEACSRNEQYVRYQPLDVCQEIIQSASERLLPRFSWLKIDALVGDYSRGLHTLPRADGRRLYVFLGGTIGNFPEDQAIDFLQAVRGVMRPEDSLLIGADRLKDRAVLNAAYNDAKGVTAAFNMNILKVLNQSLNADFVLDNFQHRAWFNEEQSRIEMHLQSLSQQRVYIRDLDLLVQFEKDETILTEISRKFTMEALSGLIERGGFVLDTHFAADNDYYSLALVRPQLA